MAAKQASTHLALVAARAAVGSHVLNAQVIGWMKTDQAPTAGLVHPTAYGTRTATARAVRLHPGK